MVLDEEVLFLKSFTLDHVSLAILRDLFIYLFIIGNILGGFLIINLTVAFHVDMKKDVVREFDRYDQGLFCLFGNDLDARLYAVFIDEENAVSNEY